VKSTLLFFCLNLLLFLPQAVLGAVSGHHLRLSADSGMRTDQLDWNIAGNSAGTSPNILSELTWRDLRIAQLRSKAELELEFDSSTLGFFLRGELGLGLIYAGKNQDSDYAGDNRTQEYSRSNNSADQGEVLDLSIAAGPKISLWPDRFILIPLAGFSYHRQNLKLLEGNQTLQVTTDSSVPELGPFPGLDSSFDAEWWGFWLGLDAQWQLNRRLSLGLLSEYHLAEFYAEGDWNLRPDFAHPVSFSQSADAEGWVHELQLEYRWNQRWALTLSGTFQRWWTDPGLDRVYLIHGAVAETRLNRVNWESTAIQLGLNYSF
jgi:hypothetical protein